MNGEWCTNRMEATNFTVIVENEEQLEISFTRMWNLSLEGKLAPLNIDKRFLNFPTILPILCLHLSVYGVLFWEQN